MSRKSQINTMAECRPFPDTSNLTFDIRAVELHGKEVAHIHTDEGVYEVYGKMGGILYAAGDIVSAMQTSEDEITIFNAANSEEFQTFTIPASLFHTDFTLVASDS